MSDIERESLLEFLQQQRDLVAWKVQDADDDALRAVRSSSGLSAHGIVRHLTNDQPKVLGSLERLAAVRAALA